MKFEVKIGYIEDYLPTPRCRKFRQREAEGQWLVTVKEVTPAKFPILRQVPLWVSSASPSSAKSDGQ